MSEAQPNLFYEALRSMAGLETACGVRRKSSNREVCQNMKHKTPT